MTTPALVLQMPGGGIATGSPGTELRTIAGRGVWPTPSPAGDRIAISVLEPLGDRVASHIDLYATDGTYLRLLHQIPPGVVPVIAPRVPHYLYWSPDGSRLCYVVQTEQALGLFVCDPTGLLLANRVVAGAPLFAAWAPGSDRLAVHAGTELHLVTLSPDGEAVTQVTELAVGFRTPCFSEDGTTLYFATARSPGVVLQATGGTGESADELGTFAGGVALARRPMSAQLSISLTRAPDSGAFDALYLLDPASGSRTEVARGPFVASFWAPTGDQVALVVPAQTGDGRYSLQVHAPDGKPVAATEGFYPSPDWRLLLGFFDQYGLSHSPWARDGSAVVVTGRLAGDGVHAAMGDANQRALTWRPSRGERFSDDLEADLAFFLARPE